MKIEIWSMGNPSAKYLQQGEAEYLKRLKAFTDIKLEILRTNKIKTSNPNQSMREEASLILEKIKKQQVFLVLLDDKGKEFTSDGFAKLIQHHLNHTNSKLIFLIGGSYGFDESIYQLAKGKISLSKFTFPHQLVRLVFLEQLYRAFSIIHHLPYHHQ